jgi:hypothetical protein
MRLGNRYLPNIRERSGVMVRAGCVLLVIVLAVGLVPSASGQVEGKPGDRRCDAIPNLLIAIQSDNDGLRESAAYYLGEYRCPNAVLPLMAMLKNSEREATRIVAALALCRIGEARGVYAVKQAVKFDTSEKVRMLAAFYYNEYYKPGTFAFIPKETASPVLASE